MSIILDKPSDRRYLVRAMLQLPGIDRDAKIMEILRDLESASSLTIDRGGDIRSTIEGIVAACSQNPTATEALFSVLGHHFDGPGVLYTIHNIQRSISDEQTRIRSSVKAYGESPDESAIPMLVQALVPSRDLSNNDRWYTAQDAIYALGRIGIAAIPALIVALTDETRTDEASKALGRIGPGAVPFLVKHMTSRKKLVRFGVAKALRDISDIRTTPAFIKALNDPYDRVRDTAASALKDIATTAEISVLAGLPDLHEDTREHIVEILGAIGDVGALPALEAAAHNSNSTVRCTVAQALGEIRDPSGVPLLRNLARDRDVQTRHNAAHSLGLIGGPSVAEPLLALLHDAEGYVSIGAVVSLVKCADLAALPAIQLALTNRRAHVRAHAASVLGAIGNSQHVPELAALLNDSDDEVRESAIRALGWLNDVSAVSVLTTAVHDPNPTVRYEAVAALDALNDAACIPGLLAAADDKRTAVSRHAAAALKRLGHELPLRAKRETAAISNAILKRVRDRILGNPDIAKRYTSQRDRGAISDEEYEEIAGLAWPEISREDVREQLTDNLTIDGFASQYPRLWQEYGEYVEPGDDIWTYHYDLGMPLSGRWGVYIIREDFVVARWQTALS